MRDDSCALRVPCAAQAVDHLNNKNDGLWDDVLPFTTIKFAMADRQAQSLPPMRPRTS